MANTANLVDELEASFQNCIALMTNQEHFNIGADADEMRNSTEVAMQRFLDAAKQLDSFFIQRRLLLSAHKPESTAKEDLAELRAELDRKNVLLQRHAERLQNWMTMINQSPSSASATRSPPGHSGIPVPPPAAGAGTPTSGGMSAGAPNSQLSSSSVVGPSQQQMSSAAASGFPSQGPLAFLEQTTSSIGRVGAPSLGGN